MIPERPVLGVAIAKFEREPAKDQGEQHHQDRKVDCRNDDGEGDREGREAGLRHPKSARSRCHPRSARSSSSRGRARCGRARNCKACRRRGRNRRARHRRTRRLRGSPSRSEQGLSAGIILAVSGAAGSKASIGALRPAARDRRQAPPLKRARARSIRSMRKRPTGIDHQIDDNIQQQRNEDIGTGQRWRDRVCRSQQSVDRPGLSPDFRRRPACDHRDESEASRELAEPQIPSRMVKLALAPSARNRRPRPPASARRSPP